tara:strand:+ start:299 stop:799 length:501 start_codon:yes stop_codon:yes gene_type:complete
MNFAYADPPYFKMGKKLYGAYHAEAKLWDSKEQHTDLVKQLQNDYPDGWALSCNPANLIWLLPHCPDDIRIGTWCKTWHQIRPTSTQFAWEAVLWRTIKKDPKRQMVRDWITGPATKQKGLPGAKPNYFNRWILDLLMFNPEEDNLTDIFPGTNGMAWAMSELKLF